MTAETALKLPYTDEGRPNNMPLHTATRATSQASIHPGYAVMEVLPTKDRHYTN